MACIHDYDFHPPDEVRYGDITVRHYAFGCQPEQQWRPASS